MPVLNAKDAVAKAVAYVGDIYRSDQVSDVLLEEIELTNDERLWRVTLSFVRPSDDPVAGSLGSALRMYGAHQGKRTYKVVDVNATDGAIRAMRIREFGDSAGRP